MNKHIKVEYFLNHLCIWILTVKFQMPFFWILKISTRTSINILQIKTTTFMQKMIININISKVPIWVKFWAHNIWFLQSLNKWIHVIILALESPGKLQTLQHIVRYICNTLLPKSLHFYLLEIPPQLLLYWAFPSNFEYRYLNSIDINYTSYSGVQFLLHLCPKYKYFTNDYMILGRS